MDWTTERLQFDFWQGQRIISSSQHPGQFQGQIQIQIITSMDHLYMIWEKSNTFHIQYLVIIVNYSNKNNNSIFYYL
jgi:hypothetical protein